jgi:rubrerythrin
MALTQPCPSSDLLAVLTSLTPIEVQALHDALNDEYHAVAVYSQALADFGTVHPFVNIRESEMRHIQALSRLFHSYGLAILPNPSGMSSPIQRFSSLKEACEAGVQGEFDNIEMYERLLNSTSRYDILNVFLRLRAASQERHLPAFQRAAARHGQSDRTGLKSDPA